ncbi:glycoside hydrolase [Wallemia mellicola]|nr:glycoside hydrolase [Wallemia mellicola]TIB88140.1 glycoside hydrolase [Wallemia mellicola]TIC26685.1 glycoside hydrolase [Wallemia mellicola]TIC40311.1 glycoside hydrolase [Wallemia mellicola]TIC48813.1 glycoside hydrolase [Wallemia mellicola]
MSIDTQNGQFVDKDTGRVVILRGVNLAASKIPNNSPTQEIGNHYDDAENGSVSYSDRPFDMSTIDTHCQRLKSFGYNCIRYVITWESLESKGPGIYDESFIDHTIKTLRKLKSYGFYVFLDPHQDLWSRFVGGSGAPIWTIHACGLQPRNFSTTESALLHNEWKDGPQNFPDMIWSTNYYRLACYTIFTLFFAGKKYAPLCKIDDYLQGHYIRAFKHLAEAIHAAGDLEDSCVLGWDSMNEPSCGLIGYENLGKLYDEQKVKLGSCPTPHQAFMLGSGYRTTVQYWEFTALGPKRRRDVVVDPGNTSAWLSPEEEPDGKSRWGWQRDPYWKLGKCIWALHDVWDDQTKKLKQPEYFKEVPQPFVDIHWKEFVTEWSSNIRSVHSNAILWIAPPVFERPCSFKDDTLGGRAALSHHYYDGLTLMTKQWHWFNADAVGLLRHMYKSVLFALKFGEKAIRNSLRNQLGALKDDAYLLSSKHYPTMIGEIGIPYDMKSTRKGKWKGGYGDQRKALDASLNACDGSNCLSYTLWSYVDFNSHEWGDGWNGEDLSIWSKDDMNSDTNKLKTLSYEESSLMPLIESNHGSSSISSNSSNTIDFLDGTRAPEAFIRPYFEYTNGTPLYMDYSISKKTFQGRIGYNSQVKETNVTEIFIPRYFFKNPKVDISEGDYEIDKDRIYWRYNFNNKSDKLITITDITESNIPQTSITNKIARLFSNIMKNLCKKQL